MNEVGKIEQLSDKPSEEWEAHQRAVIEAMNYSPTAQYWKQRAEQLEAENTKLRAVVDAARKSRDGGMWVSLEVSAALDALSKEGE